MHRGSCPVLAILAIALGALSPTGCSAEVDDAGTATAGWRSLPSAGLERTEVAAARVGRSIYVVGGFEQDGSKTTAAVERYDIDRQTWKRMAPMPIALNHPAATAYRGRVYVAGGYASSTGLADEQDVLLAYDPRRKRWQRLPSMRKRRGALGLAASDGELYAIGGAAAGTPLTTVEIYDVERRKWRTGPELNAPREHTCAAASGGALYAFAGRTGQGNLASVERLRRGSDRWQRLSDIPTARSGIACANVGDDIIVFGGEQSSGTIAPVETLNTGTHRWRSLPRMRTPRHGLGGASFGKRVYALSGGPKPGFAFSDTLEFLTID